MMNVAIHPGWMVYVLFASCSVTKMLPFATSLFILYHVVFIGLDYFVSFLAKGVVSYIFVRCRWILFIRFFGIRRWETVFSRR